MSLGQLTLVAALGVGSTGHVFRADSRGIGGLPRVVAVTALSPVGGLPSTEPWGDVLPNVHAARTLRHKGIVQTFSAGERDGLPFAVTELVEGVTLGELVRGSGALPPRSVLDVGIQVCSALASAHGPGSAGTDGQLHLDLRPSRVMVGADGVVKLRGFGLARLVDPSGDEGGRSAFSAPEVLGGKAASPASDQFALGAVLAWSVLGAAPFEVPANSSAAQQIAGIVRASSGSLAARLDKLAPGLGPVLSRMTAPEPSDRYGTVTEAEAAMRELRGGMPRGERLGRLVSRQFGRDLAELTVPGPAPRPMLQGAAPLPVPAPREERRKPPPAPRSSLPEASLTDEERPDGAPVPPPIEVPLRELVSAPRDLELDDEDLATEGGRAEAELESLDVLPAVDEASVALRSKVELEPTEMPTVVPRPKLREARRAGAPPPLAGPVASASRPPHEDLRAPSTPPSPPPMSTEQPTAPHGLAPRRTPPPSLPPARAVRDAGPEPLAPVAPGEDAEEPSDGAGRGLRIVIRVLALAIIVLGATFIVLKVILLQEQAPSVAAAVSESPASAAVAEEVPSAAVDPAAAPAAAKAEGTDRTSPPERTSRRAERDPRPPPVTVEVTPAAVERGPAERVPPSAREGRPPTAVEPASSSDLRPGSVRLGLTHRPVTSGDSGASDLVLARIEGPPDTRVVLHWGAAGGPVQETALRARGSGRWETWLTFEAPPGGRMEYWITASHPAAEDDVLSGSRSSPHVVEVR